jgi:hypothetical protein
MFQFMSTISNEHNMRGLKPIAIDRLSLTRFYSLYVAGSVVDGNYV